jgi:putative methanogenesis marker protein 3
VEIHLDGKKMEVGEGTTLATLLPGQDPRCSVAIIRPAEVTAETTPFVRVETTQGEVVIETTDPRFVLLESPQVLATLRVQWSDRYAVAFGPFPSSIQPARRGASYERGDVLLGCGGYDPKRSFLVFSKMRHLADHGGPENGGILGRVVSGRGVLDRWNSSDRIERMERILSWEDRSRSFTTIDRDLRLEHGMRIITHVEAIAQGYTPDQVQTDAAESVEHLLLAIRDGRFLVDRATSTHIRDCRLSNREVSSTMKGPRREGSITVRTIGPSRGCVYLYRTDVASNPAHTLVGQITRGIELVKLARDGETFAIHITPERLLLVGKTVQEGQTIAKEREIALEMDTEDLERIIVDQEPATTLEIFQERSLRLTTAPAEQVIAVHLDDKAAPLTCRLFREMTGLTFRPIGQLKVFFLFEDIILFRSPLGSEAKVLPENTPETKVDAFTLGMTNEVRKGAGSVGVRMICHTEFGPTGEPFEATNIFGMVMEPEKLKGIKEKETLYIREEIP